MLRFSNAAVPDGQVPSTGIMLTGTSSPRPAIIFAVTRRTNSGARGGHHGGRSQVLVAEAGTRHLGQPGERVIDRVEFFCTISSPLRP